MSNPVIRIKVLQKPQIRGKMDVRFPAKIETENFLTVTKANGVFTFGVDYTKLAEAGITNPATAKIALLDQSSGVYKIVSVADILTGGLDADLKAIAALTGTGILERTGDDAWTLRFAPTSDLVGVDDEQTLTNKTLTSPEINSPTGLVKADIGLGNVDNTSDANKPVSTATQTALNLKANTASLGTAAAADTTDFATAAQGVTADSALPLAGGTMSGDIDMGGNVLRGAPSMSIGNASPTFGPLMFNVTSKGTIIGSDWIGAIERESDALGANESLFRYIHHSNNAVTGGVSQPIFAGFGSSGTIAAPGAMKANHYGLILDMRGFDGDIWSDTSAQIGFSATSDWTPTSHPSRIMFLATPVGSISPVVVATLLGNKHAGFGTETNPQSPFVVSSNATTGVTAPGGALAGTNFAIIGKDANNAMSLIDTYSSSTSKQGILLFRTAEGTAASPAALTSSSSLGQISWAGYDGSAYSGQAVAIVAAPSENWSASAHGAYLDIYTTPSTTTALTKAARFNPSGGLSIGASTDPGVGNLNLGGGAIYNNGTAPTGTGAYVRAASPTIATPTLTGAMTISAVSGHAIGAASPGLGWGLYHAGTINATSGFAINWQTDAALTATANNNTLQALRITARPVKGAFTGVTSYGLYVAGGSSTPYDFGIRVDDASPVYFGGSFTIKPPASITPAGNGDLTFQATSNTSLTIKYKGSDGTVRSASLTLS